MDNRSDDDLPQGLRSRSKTIALYIVTTILGILILLLITIPFIAASEKLQEQDTPATAAHRYLLETSVDTSLPSWVENDAKLRRTAERTVAIQIPRTRTSNSFGSGFLVSSGVVMSAAHVAKTGFADAGLGIVVHCGTKHIEGTLLTHDPVSDVMLISAQGCVADETAIDPRELEVNDPLHICGFKFMYDPNRDLIHVQRYFEMTSPIPQAILEARNLDLHSPDGKDIARRLYLMQEQGLPRLQAISGAMIQGQSGSPIFDDEGAVVGMLVITSPRFNRSFIVPGATLAKTMRDAHLR